MNDASTNDYTEKNKWIRYNNDVDIHLQFKKNNNYMRIKKNMQMKGNFYIFSVNNIYIYNKFYPTFT